ncbi:MULTISPECIES: hypothetical protein [unclassified Bradyrhizobium]|uniref:hypothetical protein n=1 Tax=unclassified Bradyrhizobium TaxID=2631580 RepID=UPI002916D6E7|nr:MULTISPECIES: hypothetical protein [unclassified Bradyrhizobium]
MSILFAAAEEQLAAAKPRAEHERRESHRLWEEFRQDARAMAKAGDAAGLMALLDQLVDFLDGGIFANIGGSHE